MQQGRGRGGKYPKETCGQERRVESDDKAVIRLDAFHELRTQCAEFGEVAQVFDAEGHIGGFAGNVAASLMATDTFAAANAGASLIPSPTIITRRPSAFIFFT